MSDEHYLFELPPANLKVAEQKFKERNPIWTGSKAKLIERYLYYFVQITHNGIYFDGFAGPQETDKPDMWAAKLVIESRPRWFRKFHLFELEDSSVELLKQLRDTQQPRDKAKKEPKRTIDIYPGDFNKNISAVLQAHPVGDKEASFCLLDQRTFECDWKTVRTIATHKTGGNKIELFYFFPEGWMRRTPFFRPLSAENKMDSCGLLSLLFLFVCRSLCALKPFGKERTSGAWHCPSSLSLCSGFQYLPPQAV